MTTPNQANPPAAAPQANAPSAAPAAAPTAAQPPAPAAPAADNASAPAAAGDAAKTDSGTILAPADGKDGAPASDPAKPADGQTSDGKKPDGDKPEGQPKEGEPTTAEAYQAALKMPEGMEMDAEAFNAAVPVFQKYKLPPEAMNELAPIVAGMMSQQVKKGVEQHQAMVQGWHDKTIAEHGKEGEAQFGEKVKVAQKAINKFFDTDSRKLLADYGFGNHPALFAMAYQVGLAMQEDGSGSPPAGATSGQGEETLDKIWYPAKAT